MRRKRIMVVGPSRCGKTTLVRWLEDDGKPLRRTPDLIYGRFTMDCPGAYVENAWMYMHLIASAQDACCVLILVDQSNPVAIYSPGFTTAFTKPVIGVITKSDLHPENAERCEKQLRACGVKGPIYHVSTTDEDSLNKLRNDLFATYHNELKGGSK